MGNEVFQAPADEKELIMDCILIAEIGINHNGDMLMAERMIDAAKEAGANAVKFQNYEVSDFIEDHELTYTYENQNGIFVESQLDIFKRCELNLDKLIRLKRYADSKNILF